MKSAAVLFFLSAVVFCGAAKGIAADNAVYRGNVVVPEEARAKKGLLTTDLPKEFSYVFEEFREGRGLLRISSEQYYYWTLIHDWERGTLGPTSVRINSRSEWYKVVWQGGKPAKEADAAIAEHILILMELIAPRIAEQK
jgi:hypothetical protein